MRLTTRYANSGFPCRPGGYVVRGSDEDELVRNADRHIGEAHPDLVGKMSSDDLLGVAEEAT
jgi:predicted small metal-binding protein